MSVTFVVVSVVLLCFRPIFPFSSFQPFLFIGGFDSSALCRSRRELSNEYLLAKIGIEGLSRKNRKSREKEQRKGQDQPKVLDDGMVWFWHDGKHHVVG